MDVINIFWCIKKDYRESANTNTKTMKINQQPLQKGPHRTILLIDAIRLRIFSELNK